MDAQTAARAAKLLRLLSSPHGGEVLAAANRLNALASTHEVDWDLALGNGGAIALREEDMCRIYDEGYQRGLAEGQKAPAASWPDDVEDTADRADIGDDLGHVRAILSAASAAAGSDALSAWERGFCESIADRIKKFGARTWLSAKQRAALSRLEVKLHQRGFFD